VDLSAVVTMPAMFWSITVIKFKIYPGSVNADPKEDGLFFEVRVYSSRQAMKNAYKRVFPRKHPDFGAVVLSYTRMVNERNNVWKKLPVLGEVFFCRQQLDLETVAHESIHMAMTYLRRVDVRRIPKRDDSGDEESLPYVAANCTKRIFHALKDAGLIEPMYLGAE
jgi:hypothetical protein